MPAQTDPTYLGDGVYAISDGYQIILHTSNGYKTTNVIYLNPDVLEALQIFITKCTTPPEEKTS